MGGYFVGWIGARIGPGETELQQTPFVFVATPTYGGLATTSFITSLLTLQTAFIQLNIGLHVSFYSDSLVTRARNELVSSFVAHEKATHLMFIDADIGFSPDEVLRLLQFDVESPRGPIL